MIRERNNGAENKTGEIRTGCKGRENIKSFVRRLLLPEGRKIGQKGKMKRGGGLRERPRLAKELDEPRKMVVWFA